MIKGSSKLKISRSEYLDRVWDASYLLVIRTSERKKNKQNGTSDEVQLGSEY